jgi:protein TonB
MRKIGLLVALLVLVSGTAWTQQELAPSTSDGPANIALSQPKQDTPKPEPPKPDQDGVFQIGPGVTPPVLVRARPATYPLMADENDPPRLVILSAVIGVDGAAKNIVVVHPHNSEFDQSALDAISKCKFQPGSLNGNPVPVAIRLKVPFIGLELATPIIIGRDKQDDPLKIRPGDTPPRATNNVPAEFSDEARREKFGGVVIVSVIVNKEGLPKDPQVERSAGHGLDEKALESICKYRFSPATRDGKPIATRIRVEINFRLYDRNGMQTR